MVITLDPPIPVIPVWVKPYSPAEESVQRGVELLDRAVPGWYNRIDPAKLNIDSALDCICGQLFGIFSEGLKQLEISTNGIEYGFTVGHTTIAELNTAWRDFILSRQLGNIGP